MGGAAVRSSGGGWSGGISLSFTVGNANVPRCQVEPGAGMIE